MSNELRDDLDYIATIEDYKSPVEKFYEMQEERMYQAAIGATAILGALALILVLAFVH